MKANKITFYRSTENYISVSINMIFFNTKYICLAHILVLYNILKSIFNWVVDDVFGFVRIDNDVDGVIATLVTTSPLLVEEIEIDEVTKSNNRTIVNTYNIKQFDLIIYNDTNLEFLFDLFMGRFNCRRLIIISPSILLLLIYIHALMYYFNIYDIKLNLFGSIKSLYTRIDQQNVRYII